MAERMKFIAECEPWNVYRLEDGTLIRLRCVLTSCVKTDQTLPSGEPIYKNNFQIIQDVEFSDGRLMSDAIEAAAKRGGQ